MSLISESDCMSVTDLNQAVRHLCHVVETCSKLLKDSHDYSLFRKSDQKVVRNVFSFFLIEKLQKHSFALQHDQYAVLLRRRATQLLEIGLNAQQWSPHNCKTPQKICESWQMNCVFRLSLGSSTQIMEFGDSKHTNSLRQES